MGCPARPRCGARWSRRFVSAGERASAELAQGAAVNFHSCGKWAATVQASGVVMMGEECQIFFFLIHYHPLKSSPDQTHIHRFGCTRASAFSEPSLPAASPARTAGNLGRRRRLAHVPPPLRGAPALVSSRPHQDSSPLRCLGWVRARCQCPRLIRRPLLEPQHPKITRPARRQARAPRPRCARASGPRGEAGGAALEGHQDFPKMKACSSVKQTFQIILLDIFSLVLWKTVEEHFIPSALAW